MNANTFVNNRSGRKQPYHYNQFGGDARWPGQKGQAVLLLQLRRPAQHHAESGDPFHLPPSDAASQQAAAQLAPYLKPYVSGLNNDVYLAKVDWNVTANQRVSVRYNANRFTGRNFENSGQASAEEHTGNSSVNTDNISGDYSRSSARTLCGMRGWYIFRIGSPVLPTPPTTRRKR